MNKWGKKYWADLGERVASAAVGGTLAMVTANASGVVSGSPSQWWLVVGVPSAVSLLKGLLVNLNGSQPTASVVGAPSAEPAGTGPTD